MTTSVGRSPGRVNLIGEHTDYNDGLCLPLTIPYATTVTATSRDDDVVTVRSDAQVEPWTGTLATTGPGEAEGWATYAVGVVWALGRAGWELPGLDLEVESTVPMGAGLSSSAALECAVAVALAGLTGRELTTDLRHELVTACRRAESEVAGAPTGGLDQSAVLLSAPGAGLLIDFEDGSTRDIALPWADAGLTLLVVDTQVSHALTDGGYGARRDDCEAAAKALGRSTLRGATLADVDVLEDPRLQARARHVVTENARVLDAVTAVEAGDWPALGDAMTASHASLRDDYEVSCAELDLVVTTAVEAGALGARMTGGGFGGSAIALVPTARAEAVRRAVDAAFAAAGLAAPRHLGAGPSGPADLLRST
jgi:galactokinase